jgi:hypothetical protein
MDKKMQDGKTEIQTDCVKFTVTLLPTSPSTVVWIPLADLPLAVQEYLRSNNKTDWRHIESRPETDVIKSFFAFLSSGIQDYYKQCNLFGKEKVTHVTSNWKLPYEKPDCRYKMYFASMKVSLECECVM